MSRPSRDARRARRWSPALMHLEERQLLSIFDRASLLSPTVSAPASIASGASGSQNRVAPADLYRLSDDLVDLYAMDVRGMSIPASSTGFTPQVVPVIRDARGAIGVSITATDVDALLPSLQALGFQVSTSLPSHHLVEGFLPASELIDVTTLSARGLLGVQGLSQPMVAAGTVLSEADFTLQAGRTRATTPPGVDGTGVTIGVISDSYNNLNGEAAGIASGNLPSSLVFRRDLTSGGSDEGRGMMELVHDIAPGSPKAFATAFAGGEAGFAANIRDLAKPVASGGANAKVIVDDIFYFAEPMFQDGIIAQAIDDVVTNNDVAYFSSAGNLADQAYENTSPTFVTTTIAGISGTPAKYLQFSPGVFQQNVTLNAQQFLTGLQWSDPFYTASGVKSNLDIFFLSGGSVISSSTSNNIVTQVPNEILAASGTGTLQVVIRLTAGDTPTRLKYVNFGANSTGNATIQFATNSPTITPHSASVNAMSVAASPFFNQKTPESFTSKGPSTILFGPTGTPVAATIRAKPDIMATDGVSNSFFGSNQPGIGFLFFGTSAAAPNAAAVAALVRQANPSFTPAQVYSRLKATADPNVSGGVNLVGAGLVDAYRAVVGQPTAATLPLSDGFESGVLSQRWDQWNNGAARGGVTTAGAPSSGTNHLVLDSTVNSGFALSGLSEAILHVNLLAQPGVVLNFQAKRYASETIQAMPASFAGHSNTDGVAFSVDGTNWFRLNSLSTTTTGYQNFSVDLSAAAAAAGVALSADTQIKFQRFSTTSGKVGTFGLAFDNVSVTAAPTISNVTSTAANGTYATGSVIDVTVAFSAAVTVTGTPTLALNTTGGPAAVASYLSGSGTSTLVFRYTVSAGQSSSDLDYSSTGALALNGGSIVDAVANPAILTLPSPGSAGSLGANKAIVIDAVAPTVVAYRVLFGSRSFNLIGSSRVNLPWQITGIQAVFSEPIAAGAAASLTGVSPLSLAGLGTSTLTWSISTLTVGAFSTSLLGTGPNALKDGAGNGLSGGSFDRAIRVLYGDFNDDGFVSSADVNGVFAAAAGVYNIFADVNGDGVVDLNDVQIVRRRIGTLLA